MTRILVTGAEGFIGNNIITELIRNGHEIIAADITLENAKGMFYDTGYSDITKPETIIPLVKNATHIIHTAGLVRLDANPEALDKVNHMGTRNLLEAVKIHNPNIEMIVHLSSIGVYGKTRSIFPISEEDIQQPRNTYEISKCKAEKAVMEYMDKFPIIILRPSFVYGIGCQHKDALPFFRMLQGKKMPMVKKGPRASHVHVEDVANAAIFLLNRKDLAGDAFNICNDSPICLEDFVRAMAEPFDVDVRASIPYSPRAMKAMRWLMNRVPKSMIKKSNTYLQKKWNACREKNGIKEGLVPNADTAWLDYLADEKVFSIEKLESVGFVLQYNSPKDDLRKLAEYYIEKKLA
ncbi:MAG: NAD(P)-dependent oxidoreductase [Nanoarchaeota archaeon]